MSQSDTNNLERGPLTLKSASAPSQIPEDDAWQGEWVTQKAIVEGKVQGVYFRATTKEKAQLLGLSGHAKNLNNGSVEVIAQGHQDDVAELIQWLWQGSRGSKVTQVTTSDTEPYQDVGFKTL